MGILLLAHCKKAEHIYNDNMTTQDTLGIIFDFNGVIIDDYTLQKEAWSQISLILRDRPVTDEEMVNDIRGVPANDTIVWMSAENLSPARIKELARQKTSIVNELFSADPSLRLALGLGRFLDELARQNIPFTIATSQTKDDSTLLFGALGLSKWFEIERIVYYDGTYPGKPAPDAYILAARRILLEPKQCVVVEDAISGITSAYSAGVQNIVAIGRDKQLKKLATFPGVVKTIHDFTELNVDEIIRR